MSWNAIEVFNHEKYLGSFYTDLQGNENIVHKINEKYGKGNWTHWHYGN